MRNPYHPTSITRYILDPSIVDLICFYSKNPAPMLPYLNLLKPYGQYWFVTITPFRRDLEPYVPSVSTILQTFQKLSETVGINCIAWRYDPIILTPYWTLERHIQAFRSMCEVLAGYTRIVVISFVDLYEKVKRNMPEIKSVSISDQLFLTETFVEIGRKYGILIKPCGETQRLEKIGADCSGCMTVKNF